jgi:hypothetical protein
MRQKPEGIRRPLMAGSEFDFSRLICIRREEQTVLHLGKQFSLRRNYRDANTNMNEGKTRQGTNYPVQSFSRVLLFEMKMRRRVVHLWRKNSRNTCCHFPEISTVMKPMRWSYDNPAIVRHWFK